MVSVSVTVSNLGCTELVFVEAGVKVNGPYYRDALLTQHLPAIKRVSGGYFTFQQDSAPAHRARDWFAHLERHPTSYRRSYGRPTALILIRLTITSGAYWNSGCIAPAFVTSITSWRFWLKSGSPLFIGTQCSRSTSKAYCNDMVCSFEGLGSYGMVGRRRGRVAASRRWPLRRDRVASSRIAAIIKQAMKSTREQIQLLFWYLKPAQNEMNIFISPKLVVQNATP